MGRRLGTQGFALEFERGAGVALSSCSPLQPSGAAIQFSHHEFVVTENLSGREAPIGHAYDGVNKNVASAIDRHVATDDTGYVDIDMLAHEP